MCSKQARPNRNHETGVSAPDGQGCTRGYSFGLYIYGPYENDVLNDLAQAETMRAVRSSVVPRPKGYGYEFSPGPARDHVKSFAGPELASNILPRYRLGIG